jgi:polysaccharide export outer membrane protein
MTRSLYRVLILLSALIGLLPALAQTAPPPPTQAPSSVDLKKDYVIGAGDMLRITVYQNPDLSLETRVSESGAISYPLLGQVMLGGLSVTQAEAALSNGLRRGNFLKQPQVSVLLMQVRGNQASVLGMVNRPGRYPIEVTGMRLSELLAMAGGIAPTGSDIATHSGTRSGQVVRTSINIARLLTGTSDEKDPVVLNGDTVYVERMPMVYIYGEVQRPGSMRLEPGMTVMQALAGGGGPTQRGTVRGLKVHRRGADGKVREFEPVLTEPVIDGDVIYVRESLF